MPGSVMYEVLTGQTPFDSEHSYELLEMVQHQAPETPSAVSRYPVPRVLEKLCMRCLSKDPAGRPASMEEFIQIMQQNWAAELLGNKVKR